MAGRIAVTPRSLSGAGHPALSLLTGRGYELVFPVTIALPNGRTVEVDSYDEIAAQLRAYFEANSGKRRARLHFDFVYPFAVVTQDGELLSVESEEQLRRLRAACAGTFGTHGPRGHGQHGLSCFEVVFPVTIAFPDGTTAEAADRQAANQLLRTWAHNNPGSEERPVITFPMTVKMTRSGDLVTVNSPDELRSLKAGCR